MSTPEPVLKLVERFGRNLEDYRRDRYKEAQVRNEFIDPLFIALGWDVHNAAGYAEAYKDVVHEDAIKVRATDYCFRVGGRRIFFLEAKKPSVDISADIGPAYQLRRYAWSAKLPLSILTDFEELAVYDCRIRPRPADKASVARTMYVTFDQYARRWDELASIFSKQAVLEGSFDKYVVSKSKRGTAEVDVEFLKEIEEWRELLARNIALRNRRLTTRELNFAVQRTIDRIIFLRICEDRGAEPHGALQALVNGKAVYGRLMQLFRAADDRYNSGLFHFRQERGRATDPDTLTPDLKIDDKALKDIFRSLYYPQSPYEFSVLPADILGSVYEQFLGKVIHLTKSHRAAVEEKPEVRKAGGVYYTPRYIVDYIVEHTVGKLIEGKTPRQVSRLRVLDPACGSGSFLVGAYKRLLEFHRDWYLADGAEKHTRRLYQGAGGQWYLTTEEKKRILLNNVYGVDIDPQAVEVTKLNLLLCALENENQGTLGQLALIHQRALPDLASNVKCGNSLIGPDFYEGRQLDLFDEEARWKVNAFEWQAEFPEIFERRNPGFDAVIGNPPYGAEFSSDEQDYLRGRFADCSTSWDSYELFLTQGFRMLGEHGYLSMIIPASWLTGDNYALSRRLLTLRLSPAVAYALPFDVFQAAYIDTAIVVFQRSRRGGTCLIHYFPKKQKLSVIPDGIGSSVSVSNIRGDDLNRLSSLLADETHSILRKVKGRGLKFGDWFSIHRGVQPYSRRLHSEKQISGRFLHARSRLTPEYIPELQGKELSRYFVDRNRTSFIRYCDQVASSRPMHVFQGKRIVLRRLLTRRFRLQGSMVTQTMITTDNVVNIVPCNPEANVEFALGILNSRLISWLYVNTSMVAQKDDFPQVHISALANLGLPSSGQADQGRMVELVRRMLLVQTELCSVNTQHGRKVLQREFAAVDLRIDSLVYELYGLTEDEIAIVESSVT